MSDTFSDISDTELREQCLGFVVQLQSGKPATVIKMVMKSRGLTDTQINRVIKAAGGSVTTLTPQTTEAKKEKKKDKEKKEKNKIAESSNSSIPSPPPMSSPSTSSSSSSQPTPSPSNDPVKDKKKKSKKEKKSSTGVDGDSSDDDKSQALTVVDGEKEKKKKKKKDKSEDFSSQYAAAASSSDRLTSIETLEAKNKKLKIIKQTTNSDIFAQKHLGALPPSNAPQPQQKPQPVKLRAYDHDVDNVDEKMFGGIEPKKEKEGCIIC